MPLIRASVLKDFRATALSTTDVSTGYQLGPLTTGQQLYGGLHLTCATLGTTARMFALTIQSATASGFAAPTTRIPFTLSTAFGADWGAAVANVSTDHSWFRASWTLSTAVSTGGAWKGLTWMGIR